MFTRIGVESHLPGLALGCAIVSANPDHSWDSANSSNVLISTMWHNARLHDEVRLIIIECIYLFFFSIDIFLIFF